MFHLNETNAKSERGEAENSSVVMKDYKPWLFSDNYLPFPTLSLPLRERSEGRVSYRCVTEDIKRHLCSSQGHLTVQSSPETLLLLHDNDNNLVLSFSLLVFYNFLLLPQTYLTVMSFTFKAINVETNTKY